MRALISAACLSLVTIVTSLAAVPRVADGTVLSNLPPFGIVQLYQNDLNWTADADHSSFLLLTANLSYREALVACASLNEGLLDFDSAHQNKSDLLPLLDYAMYRGDLGSLDDVWVSDGCLSASKGYLSLAEESDVGRHPAFCTQSSRGTSIATSIPSDDNRVRAISAANNNTYIGFRDLKSLRFLGIPYAQVPERWTYSSVSVTQNQQVDAGVFQSACSQNNTGSEDCLYLNVYTPYIPRPSSEANLRPVMFWIHGGAFMTGTSSDPTFDGGNLVSRGDIVVVSINYRLGPLGFLTIPGTNVTGNYGIGDQITALHWVQQNIAAFGGDPERITIAGQSAGGAAVRALLSSPLARDLFHAAIAQSGPGGIATARPFSEYGTPQKIFDDGGGRDIVATLNCTRDDPSAMEACLRALDSAAFIAPLGPAYVVQDDYIIVDPRLEIAQPGSSADVPVLIGHMQDDGLAFVSPPTSDYNRTTAIAHLPKMEPAIAYAVDTSPGVFPTPQTGNMTLDLLNLTDRIFTDGRFRCNAQALAYSAARHDTWSSTWFYQFRRSYQPTDYSPFPPLCVAPPTTEHPNGDPEQTYFKCHAGELFYVFSTLGQFALPFRDEYDLPFSQYISDVWSSFVRTHDPNPDAVYLSIRQYTGTEMMLNTSGEWPQVRAGNATQRLLQWPLSDVGFDEGPQCELLTLPLTSYEQGP